MGHLLTEDGRLPLLHEIAGNYLDMTDCDDEDGTTFSLTESEEV